MPPEPQSLKSTERFTDRVDDYAKYRPHYPQSVFDMLRDELGVGLGTTVADVGSGTGISTKPLLDLGCTVYAVEPNAAMRGAAERWLGAIPSFKSVEGTAERTTLSDRSVDAIVSAQAFHWFDPETARREFARILKPAGWVVLLWNDRVAQGPFCEAYERLVREYATDYDQVRARGSKAVDTNLSRVLDRGYETRTFANDQFLDFPRLKGLLLSASYTPRETDSNGPRMVAALRQIHGRYSTDGVVRMLCETHVYFGKVSAKAATIDTDSPFGA
jgi:ubiquinone/menaquinone biosynthesis C-methylase UbiE